MGRGSSQDNAYVKPVRLHEFLMALFIWKKKMKFPYPIVSVKSYYLVIKRENMCIYVSINRDNNSNLLWQKYRKIQFLFPVFLLWKRVCQISLYNFPCCFIDSYRANKLTNHNNILIDNACKWDLVRFYSITWSAE